MAGASSRQNPADVQTIHSNHDKFALVYFSSTDWDSTWQRPQQLASRLARHGQVLYVDSFGLRVPLLKDVTRILRRVVSALNLRTRPVSPSLTVLSPLLFLPFPSRRWASRINGWLMRHSLDRWIKRQSARTIVLWIGIPSHATVEAIKSITPRLLVYDCIDNVAAFHQNRPDIIETERFLASAAQVVFATSTDLFEKMKPLNSKTFLVPNAVDSERFRVVAEQAHHPPRDMRQIKHPILGYVGEIAEWFDSDLVRDLATQNPNWSVVLIGKIHADIPSILPLPNVYHLGWKRNADVPGYLSQFDVCLLPFKVNPLTNAVNPIKLYEYLAMGKPVVSTPIREVQSYRDVVEIADPSEFSAAVTKALQTAGDEKRVKRRLEIAETNTWDIRVDEIIRILNALLGP